MMYFVGEGEKFNIKDCKKYKTLEGAVKAADKKENSTIWTEAGDIVDSDNKKVIAPVIGVGIDMCKEINQFEEIEEATTPEEEKITEHKKKFKAVVICDYSLRVRRTASWEEGNTCGLASKGASFGVKDIIEVEGKNMIQTIDDLYISADPEHVRVEKI